MSLTNRVSRLDTLSDWARALRSQAEPVASPCLPTQESEVAHFRDELGHSRAVDEPFLRHVCGLPARAPELKASSPDVALWWMTLDDEASPWPLLDADGTHLIPRSDACQIEIWTETELSALHAVWTIACIRHDADLAQRCLVAARWHVAELQPDNATNHPWAIHVFLELWIRSDSPEARLHAESLLHNCLVQRGQPDVFSAIILLDAARTLEGGSVR